MEPTTQRASAAVSGLLGVAGVLVLVGSFLTWTVSGTATRNSYDSVRAAQRIGVVGMRLWEAVLSIWFLTPLLVVVLLVGVAYRRRWLVGVVGLVLGVIVAGCSAVVLGAPVQRGPGPAACLVGGLGLVAGSVAWLVTTRRDTAGTTWDTTVDQG